MFRWLFAIASFTLADIPNNFGIRTLPPSSVKGYALTVAIMAATTLIRWALDPWLGVSAPYTMYILAVIGATWYGGARAGFLATVVGFLLGWWFFLPIHNSFEITEVSSLISLIAFLLIGFSIAGVGGAMWIAEQRAIDAEHYSNQQAENFKTLANGMPQMAFMTHPNGDVFWYNQRWYDYSGTTLEQMQGWGWQSIHDPNELPKVMERWKSSIHTGKPFDMVFPIKGKDDIFRPFLTRILPLVNKDGQVTRWFGTSTDISEAKRAEEVVREARSRLESTLAAGEIGTWEFDVVNNVVRSDRNLARMYGVSDEEAAGGPLEAYSRAIHPDDRQRLTEAISAALESGHDLQLEYRLIDPDGNMRWVIARGRVERDSEGKALRLPGVVVDITEQREAEQALRASEDQRRLALEAAEMGAWNLDAKTKTLTTDSRFRKIFGVAGDSVSYEEAVAIIPAEEREDVLAAVAASTSGENPVPYDLEHRVIHPDGSMRWVYVKGRANVVNGELVSLNGTVTDITERRALEDDLRQLASDLSEANRQKDEFLATLAHELRNPLAPIRNSLQILKVAEGDPATTAEAREIMERQVVHMVRLVDDLLDVSRITRGKVDLRLELVDIATVIQQAVETSRPAIEAARQQLTVNVPAEPVFVNGDNVRLAQVFSNLINNACKYSQSGGSIIVTVARQGNSAEISCKDTGVGISAEMLPKVFDMFIQGDSSLERATGGLGIGLTLVKRLVELHNGMVRATSAGPGQGSEFIVSLPVVEAVAVSPAKTPTNGADKQSAAQRILVVDDNKDSALTLAMLLKKLGHDIQSAHDGLAAYEAAEKFQPAVVLLDIGLPHLNGYEVARKIRQQRWGESMVLIALTGWGQDDDRQKSAAAGFNAHLVKPVEFATLKSLLSDLLAAHTKEDSAITN